MSIKYIILIIVGFVMLGLGAIGLVIPIWPTTPFVIVSAACFSCAPALQKRLENIPFLGEHITNYRNKTGLTKKTVVMSLTFLWSMLILSCFLIERLVMTLLLLVIGIAVTIHIIFISKGRNGKHEE